MLAVDAMIVGTVSERRERFPADGTMNTEIAVFLDSLKTGSPPAAAVPSGPCGTDCARNGTLLTTSPG